MKNSADLKREFKKDTGLAIPEIWEINCVDHDDFYNGDLECSPQGSDLLSELPRMYEYLQWLENKLLNT